VNGAKVRLIVAAALLVGWLAWLGYTAATKNRGPVISPVQAAATAHVIVGEITVGPDDKPALEVKVVESLKTGSPAAGATIFVTNLSDAKGFDGPGEYLLLLSENPQPRLIPVNGQELPMHTLVGMQRSPGYELSGGPTIYRMSNEIRAQVKKLFP